MQAPGSVLNDPKMNHHMPPLPYPHMDENLGMGRVPNNGYPGMHPAHFNPYHHMAPQMTSPEHMANGDTTKTKKDRKRKSSEKPGVGPVKMKNEQPQTYADMMIKQEPGSEVAIKHEPLWEGCPSFEGYDFPAPKPAKVKQKKLKQEKITDSLTKKKPKRDRFNGMSEEEVLQRVLPDHIKPDLDIVIIGINPGLTAAFVGHHYAGPGNHFWKCLFLSGFIPEPMNAYDDHKLLNFGIGFTNIVERTSRGSADLTKKEIKEGGEILLKKLQEYKPKIAAFNGKGIYEVFCGHKNFHIGKQPDPLPGTDTMVFVMPSSSARFTQLPRAIDKVPFYVALKKLRDYVKGDIKELDESEVSFPDLELKVKPRADRIKAEENCESEQKMKGQFMQITQGVKQEDSGASQCQGGQSLWQPHNLSSPPHMGHPSHPGMPGYGHMGALPMPMPNSMTSPPSGGRDDGSLFSPTHHQLVPVKQENMNELAQYTMMHSAGVRPDGSPGSQHAMPRVKSENQADYAAYGLQPANTGCPSQQMVSPTNCSYPRGGGGGGAVGQYQPSPYVSPYPPSMPPNMMYPNASPMGGGSSFSMSLYNHMSSSGQAGYGYSSMSFTGMLSDHSGVAVSAVAQGSSVRSHSWPAAGQIMPQDQEDSSATYQQQQYYQGQQNATSPSSGSYNNNHSDSPEKSKSP